MTKMAYTDICGRPKINIRGRQVSSRWARCEAGSRYRHTSTASLVCAAIVAARETTCEGKGFRRMEVEGKTCNAEKRAGHVPGHQLNQRCALMLRHCVVTGPLPATVCLGKA